ncbi:MAG: immunoglobulin domain-containing protein, partial [Verrucomicrobiota bacterium]
YPNGVAVDVSGNVYVADSSDRKIRKITSAGVVTTLAGSGDYGSANGNGTAASFRYPNGVAVDVSGNVYVADSANHKIRKITSAGVVTTLAGSGSDGSADGPGAAATFWHPYGVAVDGSGNVYVANSGNGKIRKITKEGIVTTLAGFGETGFADGLGTAAKFSMPTGVAVDVSGNVYVADSWNNKIRKITSAGVVTTLAGSGSDGSADGPGAAAKFSRPAGAAVDGSGNVYVADCWNHKIRKITSEGMVTTLAGSGETGFADGPGTAAKFSSPVGVAVDVSGNVYVADSGNNKIRKITSAGVVTTLAGSGSSGASDGPGTAASFDGPRGVAVDGSGNVYVADSWNNMIRKVTSAGVVTTLAGSGPEAFSSFSSLKTRFADGPGTAAMFCHPCGVAVDGSGNVYVADSWNHKIRKITSEGMVSTLAGSGPSGLGILPIALGINSNGGNLTGFNLTGLNLFLVNVAGYYLAGAGSVGSADGLGTAAGFSSPAGVAVDVSGNVYVADSANNKIRKITSAGVVTTLAGAGSDGAADGPGTSASFSDPYGVAVDGSGNVYVADSGNTKVRKITTGTNINGATAATYTIGTVGIDDSGSYECVVTDQFSNVVVSAAASLTVGTLVEAPVIKIQPAGSNVVVGGTLQLSVAATDATGLTYQWYKDGVAIRSATKATYKIAKVTEQNSGSYTVRVSAGGSQTMSSAMTINVRDPIAQVYGKTGQLSSRLSLKPTGATEAQPALLNIVLTRTGAVSANLLVNGKNYSFKGNFNSELKIEWDLPSVLIQKKLTLKISDVTEGNLITTKITTNVDDMEYSVSQGGNGPFDVSKQYVNTYIGSSALRSGYVSVSMTPKTGRLVVVGALPSGDRFTGSGMLQISSESTAPVAELLFTVKKQPSVFSEFHFLAPSVSGNQMIGSSQLVPLFVAGITTAPIQSWDLALDGRYSIASTKQLIASDYFTPTYPNLFDLRVDSNSENPVIAGTLKVDGLKFVTTASIYAVGRGRPVVNVDPVTGLVNGSVGVKDVTGKVTVQNWTGVFLGTAGVQGMTAQGKDVSITNRPGSNSGGLSSPQMTSIILSANNGWRLEVWADGAAVIESGSLDSAGVRVGTIDFDRLMKLVEDDLKVGTASNGSLLAGGILYPNQHSITLLPIGSVQIWNDLMEQLNGKFISLSQTRFNELVAKVPLLLK